MYLPVELVDLIIYHSVDVNLRHYMSTRVFPELKQVSERFHMFRCDECTREGLFCVDCAREYGYESGPGYYYGKRYVISDDITHDEVLVLNKWWNNRDIEVHFGDELDYDPYALRLKYNVEKYNKGTLEHLMYESKLSGFNTFLIEKMIEIYYAYSSENKYIDSCNIKSFCSARGIEEYHDFILSQWIKCMY